MTATEPAPTAGDAATREPYGIVVSKDVMLEMRDGIHLATDLHRPGRGGELAPGRFPTIVCITPYDKTERRYTEIADFFVPHGYAVVLQDLRDRHHSEGTKQYFHSATPHNLHTFDFADGTSVCSPDGGAAVTQGPQRVCGA